MTEIKICCRNLWWCLLTFHYAKWINISGEIFTWCKYEYL